MGTMDDEIKFHQTWHLHQLTSFYQQFLFIFYSVYKNKPRGVTVRQLIKFIKKNYYLDGDLCHQMVTVLRQAIDQGMIEERCEKYHLVGPIASVQNTAPNSSERRNELRNVTGIFNFNSTQRKPRSRRSDRDNKTLERQNSNNSESTIKRERIINASTRIKSGSQEKCPSIGLALQEKNVTDALQSRPNRKTPDKNPLKFVPNITVLSKIKQYFETSVCKCQSRTLSKSKSKTKSSLNKPSSHSTSSLSMKTASQNSNQSKNDKQISLKSHDNSTDEYFSSHSKSDKLKQNNSKSQNSKSPKLKDSSQGISLQATRSKTPSQYTTIPGQKQSDVGSSVSKYSDNNNKSVLSLVPILSTVQHFLGCKDCSDTKNQVSPSTRLLRPRTTTSKNSLYGNNVSLKKQQLRSKFPKRLINAKFRTMGRNRCNGQFCSLRRKCSTCKPCKIKFPRPITANSSRPLSKNTYTATRTSMRTRSSTRGRCISALSSKLRSLGSSSTSLKSVRSLKPRKKYRKNSASSFKMPIYKRRKLNSRDSSLGDSYWGDFCCT